MKSLLERLSEREQKPLFGELSERERKMDKMIANVRVWWIKKTRVVKRCPSCGSRNLIFAHILTSRIPWMYYVECDDCHYCGMVGLFRRGAVWNWNHDRGRKERES